MRDSLKLTARVRFDPAEMGGVEELLSVLVLPWRGPRLSLSWGLGLLSFLALGG